MAIQRRGRDEEWLDYQVHHGDTQVKNILGIYAKYMTTVYGE